ncbi:MAG: DUF3021 domain-containing protein [Bifidobacteriaceae bacterium]|jgi:hypothetical protein|nr:DUF3021 domain-containing protein [Bifidobacteriaceae bacterium]MCI1914939.1 DUF3021 domain-containing protein [Bifidobacteriaceae bacterium]
MKKTFQKILISTIGGIGLGQFIGFWMATIFSAANGTGQWMPSTVAFVNAFPSHLLATIVSAIIWSAIGIVFSVSAILIFPNSDMGSWKQTGIYYVVTLVLFTPLACVAGWFPLSWYAVLAFIPFYTVIFLIIGLFFWLGERKNVTKLNEDLKKSQH